MRDGSMIAGPRVRRAFRSSPYDLCAVPKEFTTGSDWLRENARGPFVCDLAGVARRVLGGEDFLVAVREFLDEFGLRGDDELRAAAIAQPPALTGDGRYDAYLGALAEHLAVVHELERPAWSTGPDRFLDRFWFVSDVPGFRAISIAQAPAAFKRRGVFVPERTLHRV